MARTLGGPMHTSTTTAQIAPAQICASCAAHDFGLCGMLGDACSSLLSPRCHQTRYKRGDELALQGELTDRIGIISSGLVKVVLMTADGEHHILQLLKPGHIVGDPCKAENAFSWEAATSARICWVNRATLNALIRDEPQIYRAYLAITAQQLEEHRLWAASMRGRNTLQRIAFWIVQQLPDARDGAKATVRIPLTRRDLASLLDMTVETLCRGLHQLADRNAICLLTPEEIDVVDMTKLRLFGRCGEDRVHEVLNAPDTRMDSQKPFCIARQQTPARTQPIPAQSSRSEMERRHGKVRLMTAVNDDQPKLWIPDRG